MRKPAPPTLSKPPPGSERPAPLLVPAAGAALWAAAVGVVAVLVPVLVVWVTAGPPGAGVATAVRAALRLWLLAHGAGLDLSRGTVAIAPLGLTGLVALVLLRAGAVAGRRTGVEDLHGALRATAALTAAYGTITAFATAPATGDGAHPSALRALLGGLAVAALAGGAGIARAGGVMGDVFAYVPLRLRRVGPAAAAAIATMAAGGAAIVAIALAASLGEAATVQRTLDAGVVGGLALLLAGLVVAPNAVVWAAAYATGPGFAVGAGTRISPLGGEGGPVPTFPLLAALPGAPAPRWTLIVLVLPLLAGTAAGALVVRRARPLAASAAAVRTAAARTAVADAALAGGLAGLGLGVLAALAGGPAGPGRLVAVGPSPWQVALAASLELAAAAAATAATAAGWRWLGSARPGWLPRR